MKNTVAEMRTTVEGINSRLNDTAKWITELEDRIVKTTATEQKKMKRNKVSLRDLWDNIKPTNIHIIGVPEGEERESASK